MAQSDSGKALPRALFVAAVVICGLYFAQEVLVPIALGILLSFILAPVVLRLERWHLGRVPSVLIVALLSFAAMGGIGYLFTIQLVDLAEKLPSYRGNIEQKIRSMHGRTGRVFTNAQETINQLEKELSPEGGRRDAQPSPASKNPTGGGPPPTPVEVVKTPENASSVLSAASALLSPMGRAAIVALFVIFLLIYREDTRDRVVHIMGTSQMNMTTEAFDDAGARISRYLLAQLAVNAAYGLVVAIGLWLIGVPNALLWGLLLTVLRFLPYIGILLATAGPFVLSFGLAGWWPPISTLALFGVMELVANYLEPQIYGASTGISSVGVLVAATFWGWLWGGVGLLLSTPLTVLLVVLGKHIPQLAFFNVLFGDEQVLEPQLRLYQRLLAEDYDDARELLEEAAKEQKLLEIYDRIVIPSLGLTEQDYHLGRISESKHKSILDGVREIVGELGAQGKPVDAAGTAASAGEDSEIPVVLCFPARDEADEIAGLMLKQVLPVDTFRCETVAVDRLAGEMLEMACQPHVKLICISAVPPAGTRHARYLYKRVRSKLASVPIVNVLWNSKLDRTKARRRIGASENDIVVFNLAEAATQIRQHVEAIVLRERAQKTLGSASIQIQKRATSGIASDPLWQASTTPAAPLASSSQSGRGPA